MSPDVPPAVHAIPLAIAAGDIDQLGHVNNVVYLRWVQEAAMAHWFAAATPEQQAAVVWVVRRHEIDYRAEARPGDALEARTWVAAWTGVTSDRRTEIVRVGDGKVLAAARTAWLQLDATTRRPRRIDEALAARFATA